VINISTRGTSLRVFHCYTSEYSLTLYFFILTAYAPYYATHNTRLGKSTTNNAKPEYWYMTQNFSSHDKHSLSSHIRTFFLSPAKYAFNHWKFGRCQFSFLYPLPLISIDILAWLLEWLFSKSKLRKEHGANVSCF